MSSSSVQEQEVERRRKGPPNLPLKAKLLIGVHTFSVNMASNSDYTINRGLVNVVDPKVPPSSKPINGVSSFDTIIDSSRNLWLRLYSPTTTASTLPLIVYYHGGGFCLHQANSTPFDHLCRRMAKEVPAIVISVNYRLAPEFKYPTAYEDGFDALKFIDTMEFKDMSTTVDRKQCFLSGDSAGGNLAHHVALKASEHEFSNIVVIGFIAIMPFFGGEERTEAELTITKVPILSLQRTDWMWKAFLPEGSDRNHPAAHVFDENAVDILALKFPETLLVIGGWDLLQDWQKKYCEWLRKNGKEVRMVEYPNAIHGFYCIPDFPETSRFLFEVREFVKRKCG